MSRCHNVSFPRYNVVETRELVTRVSATPLSPGAATTIVSCGQQPSWSHVLAQPLCHQGQPQQSYPGTDVMCGSVVSTELVTRVSATPLSPGAATTIVPWY
ncbi:hypothetical protein J6590_023262 [Homalodisca vitripennis]|nr:hypothetical protein J6590_023262 [Homalodisca vitripennis]